MPYGSHKSNSWTQVYDPINLAILRDPVPDAPQWGAIYTAGDERLASWAQHFLT